MLAGRRRLPSAVLFIEHNRLHSLKLLSRNLPLAPVYVGKRPHIDFRLSRSPLVGLIGEPSAVRRDLAVLLAD